MKVIVVQGNNKRVINNTNTLQKPIIGGRRAKGGYEPMKDMHFNIKVENSENEFGTKINIPKETISQPVSKNPVPKHFEEEEAYTKEQKLTPEQLHELNINKAREIISKEGSSDEIAEEIEETLVPDEEIINEMNERLEFEEKYGYLEEEDNPKGKY